MEDNLPTGSQVGIIPSKLALVQSQVGRAERSSNTFGLCNAEKAYYIIP